jgi:DNA-directed RNA polymerase subunit N (RpoN/RPB10)
MIEALLRKVKQGIGTTLDLGGRQAALLSTRNQYLDRGREYGRFTLPYIVPDNDDKNRGADANQHGYQGIGAQAVNHLANKLTTTLFPVQRSFFKLEFESEARAALQQAGYEPTELSELLVEAEKRAETYQTKIAARVAYVDAFKNLLITGNVLMYAPKDGNLQAIKLNRYCCRRDTSGRLCELVIEDKKAFSSMAQDVQDTLRKLKGPGVCKKDEDVTLYTWVIRTGPDTFGVTQSALGVQIKSWQELPEEDLPWIPLMFNHTNGEDYGRGLVEDHAGDFYVIEFLSEALAKGMALMADIKYFLRPGSIIDIDEVATSPIGEWILGNIEDVGVLQLEKYADFKPISEVLNEYKRRIGQAFLMNSAVRRDAERVTTVELRIDAQELETSLGGVYTLLAQTMQSPLARRYLKSVGFPLPQEKVIPQIVTGLSALGRVGDLDKIKQFTEMMQLPQVWPAPVQQRTKWDVYAREVAAGLSMKMPWMMTDEEWEAQQKKESQAQQAGLAAEALAGAAEKAGPELINKALNQ